MSQFDIISAGEPGNDWGQWASAGNPWGYDSSGTNLYVDPELLIGFQPSDPEYATYEAQMLAPSNVRSFAAIAGGSYSSLTASLDALSNPEQGLFLNIENPWNSILARTDAQGVDEAWRSNANAIAEFTRQSYPTAIGVATLDDFRAVGIQLRRDVVAYAKALGATRVMNWDGGLIPPINADGTVASGVSVTGTPLTEATWWTSSGATLIDTRATTRATDGSQKHRRLSQQDDDVFGISSYKFYADLQEIWDEADNWARASADRRAAGGTGIQTDDFSKADYLFWIDRLCARETYELRRCFDIMVGNADMTQLQAEKPVAVTIIPDSLTPDIGIFPSVHFAAGVNAWGPNSKTVDQVVDEVRGHWGAASTDAPDVLPPQEVWFWHDVRYFWTSVPALATTGGGDIVHMTRAARFLIESWAFGRDRAASFPWNTTDDTTLRNHFAANCLGDGFWNGTDPWWTTGGGSQIGPDCVLDENSPLAPWLDFTANIGRTEILKALRHALSTRMVEIVTRSAEFLRTVSPGPTSIPS